MLVVSLPSIAKSEVEYTLDIVCKERLGLEYSIKYHSEPVVLIEMLGRSEKLTFSTSFFERYDLEGLSLKLLPSQGVLLLESGQIPTRIYSSFECKLSGPLPVLYGDPCIEQSKAEIKISIDIFGIIFFMLSRCEELILSERDLHDRFPASASLAYKEGFLERPIVDEYVELLWACMKSQWPELKRKVQQPQTYISCDVDTPFDSTVRSLPLLAKTCIADVVKRRSFPEALRRVRRYINNKKEDYRYDPNYTFDWYMDVCERAGLKTAFYFIPTSLESNNGDYKLTDRGIENLLIKIHSRGHEIGVHGSYQTYLDSSKILKQKNILENTLQRIGINQKIRGNRQHYLRWNAEITPELLDEAGFEYDSSGGYADYAGFRYGTAYEFSMWGWGSRKKLALKQRPLIVMENTLIEKCYMGLGKGDACIDYVRGLVVASRNYNGNFALLWHNSSLRTCLDKELFLKCISIAGASS